MSADYKADVAVIGSGVSGALVAARLAEAGVKVVILEAGPKVDRNAAVERARSAIAKTPESAYEDVPWAQRPRVDRLHDYYVQKGPDIFGSTYERVVGGTTWHWLGTVLRFLPNDFRMRSKYGIGVDWPISYDDLEPWYGQAENELGVAGDDAAPLGAPRSTPFPLPPIPPSYLDRKLADALEPLGFTVVQTPQARNSITYRGRPACCGSASCIPICPVGAKYDATLHVDRAVAAGAQLITPAVVTRLLTDQDGRITAAVYRDPVAEKRVEARQFVLAAHAIEGPRLLLLSASERYPKGLANSSDQLGRNLMDHPSLLSYALSNEPVYPLRSPISTSAIEQFRDGDFRASRSGMRIEIGNDAWLWPIGVPPQFAEKLIEKGLRGGALREAVNEQVARQYRLASSLEQLPDPENRVTLDPVLKDGLGLPRPRIRYAIDDYAKKGRSAAIKLHDKIFRAFGSTNITHVDGFFGAGHIAGTTRMGKDPRSSVVDADLRSHDHPNLFILGSGTFPTIACSNPTLTIAALALRSIPTIQKALVTSGVFTTGRSEGVAAKLR